VSATAGPPSATERAATTSEPDADAAGRRPVGLRRFVVLGLLTALLLAGVVSAFASASPDGLDTVTRAGCTFDAHGDVVAGHCLAEQARAHGLQDSPFAGYQTRGVGGAASTGVSGVVGVLVTLGIAFGLATVLRRRGPSRRDG
jgi:cobalt/nickel transport protein